MKPPRDFRPPLEPPEDPTVDELLALADQVRRNRLKRQRDDEWKRVREEVRREASGKILGRSGEGWLPAYLGDRECMGPFTLRELRSLPRRGRVAQAGVDTWSPAWYAEPGSPLERAISQLAVGGGRKVKLVPQPVMDHRVGWFPDAGLVFAEGHPGGSRLGSADDLPIVLEQLEERLQEAMIPVTRSARAGIRRVDATVDLITDSPAEGLAILAGVAALSVPGGKLVTYRSQRAIETVLMKSRAGKTVARVYDKGIEAGVAPRGRLLRPEDQRRFSKETRRDASELTTAYIRDLYRRRFTPLYESARGIKVAGLPVLAERLREAIEAGVIEPSRARSLAGYLLLETVDAPQGSRSTRYALEKECRELGLVVGDGALQEIEVDLGAVLEECLDADAWSRSN